MSERLRNCSLRLWVNLETENVMDHRLNRHIENQIKSWVFQMEHSEAGAPSTYASFDSYRVINLPVRERIQGSSDEQFYSRF